MNAFKQLVDFLQVYAKSPILNPPASPGDLSEFEDVVGNKLPEDVRAAYRLGNGEVEHIEPIKPDKYPRPWIFSGKAFYSTHTAIDEYLFFKELLDDGDFEDFRINDLLVYPTDTIKDNVFNPNWIPISGASPVTIAIDFDPAPNGIKEQVILFSTDNDKYFQLGTSFNDFCLFLLDQYKQQKMHLWVLRDDDPDKEEDILYNGLYRIHDCVEERMPLPPPLKGYF